MIGYFSLKVVMVRQGWTKPTVTSNSTSSNQITINRPERRNAFRPETVSELQRAFTAARDDPTVGAIIFTGKGDKAFCSGGDQAVRGKGGYVGGDTIPRLNVLDLQVQPHRQGWALFLLWMRGMKPLGGNSHRDSTEHSNSSSCELLWLLTCGIW